MRGRGHSHGRTRGHSHGRTRGHSHGHGLRPGLGCGPGAGRGDEMIINHIKKEVKKGLKLATK